MTRFCEKCEKWAKCHTAKHCMKCSRVSSEPARNRKEALQELLKSGALTIKGRVWVKSQMNPFVQDEVKKMEEARCKNCSHATTFPFEKRKIHIAHKSYKSTSLPLGKECRCGCKEPEPELDSNLSK